MSFANVVIAIGVAIIYLAFGFGFALFCDAEDDLVMFSVFLWPLAILTIVLSAIVLSINKPVLAIFHRLKELPNE